MSYFSAEARLRGMLQTTARQPTLAQAGENDEFAGDSRQHEELTEYAPPPTYGTARRVSRSDTEKMAYARAFRRCTVNPTTKISTPMMTIRLGSGTTPAAPI